MARIQYQPASRSRGFKPRNLSTAGINRMREESNRIIQNMEKNRQAEKEQRDRDLQAIKENNEYEAQIERENFNTQLQNLKSERNQTVTGLQLEGAEAQAQQAKTQAILTSISSLSKFAASAVTAIDADLLKKDVADAHAKLAETPTIQAQAQIDYDVLEGKAQEAQVAQNAITLTNSVESGGSQIQAAKTIASGPVLTGRGERIYNNMLYERDYKALYSQSLGDTERKFTAGDGTTFTGAQAISNSYYAGELQRQLKLELDGRFNVTEPRAYSKAYQNINRFNEANLVQVRASELEEAIDIGVENATTLIYGGGNPATHADLMQAGQTLFSLKGFKGMHETFAAAVADTELNDETRELIQTLEFNGEPLSKRTWMAGALAKYRTNKQKVEDAEYKLGESEYQNKLLNNYSNIQQFVEEDPLNNGQALLDEMAQERFKAPVVIKDMIKHSMKRDTEATKLLIEQMAAQGTIDTSTVNRQPTADLRQYAAEKLEEYENVKYGEKYGTFKKALLGSVKTLFATDVNAPINARLAGLGIMATEYYDDLIQNKNHTPQEAAQKTELMAEQAKAGAADSSNPFYSVSGKYNTRTYPAITTDPVYAAQKRKLLDERILIDQRNIVNKPYYINTEPELDKVIKSAKDGVFLPTRNMLHVAESLDIKVSEVANSMRKAYNEINGTNKELIQLSPAVKLIDAARTEAAELMSSIYPKQVERGGASTLGTAPQYLRSSMGGATGNQRQALLDVASEMGVDPLDLATIIGFETGGTYNPGEVGGEGDNYQGLIQFGGPERTTYGVTPGMTFEEQLRGPVLRYFKDRFNKAGMDTRGANLLQLYTTVLAGNPGANPDAADSFGTTARDAVNPATEKGRIMAQHREAARKRFGF